MATDIVLITHIEQKPTRTLGRTLYKISDSSRAVYATTNGWLAALAERYLRAETPVHVHSASGWWMRELTGIVPAVRSELLQADVISHAEFESRR